MTNTPPAGWYPDPSGADQWRVWNGQSWTDLTRPYGPAAPARDPVGVALLHDGMRSLRALLRYGIAAYFMGLGLLVSVIVHRPGQDPALSPSLYAALLGAALGFLLIGTAAYAVFLRHFLGRWTLEGLLPGINVIVTTYVVAHHVAPRHAVARVAIEAVIVILFCRYVAIYPAVCVLLAYVAQQHVRVTQSLLAAATTQMSSPEQHA